MRYITFILLFFALSACNESVDMRPELVSDAGADQLDIANAGYKVTLEAAELKSGQTGEWFITSGRNGVVAEPNNPNSEFSGEPGQTYVIQWKASDLAEEKYSYTSVRFKEMLPTFHMSLPEEELDNMYMELYGSLPKYGANCKWEILQGENGVIENADSHEATIWGDPEETYEIQFSHIYGDAVETIDFEVTLGEFSADAGGDRMFVPSYEYNEKKVANLWGYLPYGANGTWEIINGDGLRVLSPNNPHSLMIGDPDVEYQLKWTVDYKGLVDADTVSFQLKTQWDYWVDSRDGNGYRTIKLGNLEWMVDNFRYVGRNDNYEEVGNWNYGLAENSRVIVGDPVDTEEERKKYGRIYTLHHANLYAPEGWRLPTEQEWLDMMQEYGGVSYAAPAIRENGESGLELSFAGFYNTPYASWDPSFDKKDELGTYWCYAEVTDYSTFEMHIEVYPRTYNEDSKKWSENENVVLSPVGVWYGLSVRYVRDLN